MSPLLPNRLLEQSGMDRATVRIDIHSVRLITDHFDLQTELTQLRRRNLVGCAMGTIDHHLDALKIQVPWKRTFDELDVTPFGIINSIGFSNGPGFSGHQDG